MTSQPLTVVLDAFTAVMGEPAPNGAATVPDDVEAWTSVNHVYLVCEIESRLSVKLPESALMPWDSLGGLAEQIPAARQ
jgi:acyl carrier protein